MMLIMDCSLIAKGIFGFVEKMNDYSFIQRVYYPGKIVINF